MNKMILIGVVLLCSILGAVGQLFFKIGGNPFNPFKLSIGLFLYGIATILFIGALRFGQLSVLYPIISLSYIFVMFLSWKFLGESISFSQWIGAFGIIISVGLIVK